MKEEQTPHPTPLRREDFLAPDGTLDYHCAFFAVVAWAREAFSDLVVEESLQAIVSPDYPQAMAALSQQLGKDLTPTNSDGALGMAMSVDAGDYDIIVVDAGIIEGLFTPAISEVLHLIHHELAHSHDHAVNRKGWTAGLREEPGFPDLRKRMFPLAHKLWVEYQAERRSAATIQAECQQAPLLMDLLERLPMEISLLILSYRMSHGHIPRLMDEVCAKIATLCLLAGYVLGDLAGTGSEPSALHPGLPAAMSAQPLGDLWKPILEALDKLYQDHGSWGSSEVFMPLEDLLVQVFRRFGMALESREEGLWLQLV